MGTAASAPSRAVDPSTDSPADDLDALVRRLLDLLGRVTGLQSTYLTAIDLGAGEQEILYARNVGSFEIPEGLRVAWSDTLCRRALEGGPPYTDDVARIYPDSDAARELGIRTYVTVPVLGPSGAVFGTLCGADARSVEVTADVFAVMEALAEMVELQLANDASRQALASANDTLAQLVYIDALTGVGNRRAFERDLSDACARSARSGAPLAVVAVDVDRFKSINDTLGHAAGDEVLQEIGRRLVQHCRRGDTVARLGGDEFVAILFDADVAEGGAVAERLRADIADRPFMTTWGPAHVSVSVGVASGLDADHAALVERADGALYAAKTTGRDAVAAG